MCFLSREMMGMAVRDPRAQMVVRDVSGDRVAVKVEILFPDGEVVLTVHERGEVPEWLKGGPLPGWVAAASFAVESGDGELFRPFAMIVKVVAGREDEAREALA